MGTPVLPDKAPSAAMAALGNALGQAARPAVLLVVGVSYGADVAGNLSATFGLMVLGTVALYPALGFAVTRHRADFRLSTGLIRRMATFLAAGTFVLAVLLAVDELILHLLQDLVPGDAWVWWLVLLVPITVAEQYALGLASVAGTLDQFSATMAASRIALIAASFLAAVFNIAPVWLLPMFAASSVAVLLSMPRLTGRLEEAPAPRGLRRDGWAAAPNAWAWFLIAQGGVLIVQATLGARAAGLFTVAYLLLNLPILALQGTAIAWMSNAARRGPSLEWSRTRRFVFPLVATHATITGAIALVGAAYWAAWFGDDLAQAFPLLARMALGAPGFALAYLLMQQWVARGWFKRLSAVYLALALAYLATVAFSIRIAGLEAAAWSTAGLGIALAVANVAAAATWDQSAKESQS
jgi:hypothetical protein